MCDRSHFGIQFAVLIATTATPSLWRRACEMKMPCRGVAQEVYFRARDSLGGVECALAWSGLD